MIRSAILLTTLALAGCSMTEPTRTGFLTNYDRLTTTEENPRDPNWVSPSLVAGRYSAFIIDEIAWRTVPESPARDAETRAGLQQVLHTRLTEAMLARGLRQADAPGAGVLRVRAAITDTQRAQPVVNVIAMAARIPLQTTGGASTEAELGDSLTGETLAALTAYNNGGMSFLGGPIGGLSQFGHARRAFTVQANRLAGMVPVTGGVVAAR